MNSWLLAFIVALLTSLIVTRLVMAIGISDQPDEARKLHKKVTPTSGGIGIMAGISSGLAYGALNLEIGLYPKIYACIVLAIVGGGLGLLDDIKAMGSKRKLLFMLIATSGFAVFGARIETLMISPNLAVPLGIIIGSIGTIFWLLVMVNTVNFMDGANGMAMGCAALGLLGLWALNIAHMPSNTLFKNEGGDDFAFVAFVGGAACIGFLFWNAVSGKVFAGDCGALSVGLLCGSLGVFAVIAGVNALAVATCFLPMLTDVILTVIVRIKRRQNVLLAHSDHAYQVAIRHGASHVYTAGRYWLATFFCVVSACVGEAKGGWLPAGLFVFWVVMLSAIYFATLHIVAESKKQGDIKG